MPRPRYLEKFESADALTTYTFPLEKYSWEPSQALGTTSVVLAGASGAFDLLGGGQSLRRVANDVVKFVLTGTASEIEDTLSEMAAKLYEPGRGKLFVLDSQGNRRWAWARLSAMPVYRMEKHYIVPVTLKFKRYTFWHAPEPETGSVEIDEDGETFTIDNPGSLGTMSMVFRLRSGGASGFTNPRLVNDTNGWEFSSTRDAASADSELRVNTGAFMAEYSNDDGETYADDFGLFSRGPTQVGIMKLEPGLNSFTYHDDGTPDCTLEWSYYPVFA